MSQPHQKEDVPPMVVVKATKQNDDINPVNGGKAITRNPNPKGSPTK
jgi:hypothetical protein